MLFDSYAFIFAFAPMVLLGFGLFARRRMGAAIGFLAIASFVYYGWWDPRYLLLLSASIASNWSFGRQIAQGHRPRLLAVGIASNLALLGYFKYAGFLVAQFAEEASRAWDLDQIVLPIGISFFTFQQIAYLVDAHRGRLENHGFREYVLFVSFFPQLIAGPIVHQREMLQQFGRPRSRAFEPENVAAGLALFAMGLAKKVLLADNVAAISTPIFVAVEAGYDPTFVDAWVACLGYTLQIYFDFSAYSDMAIGLGFLFGIRLPLNFDSPYRSPNIIEFWRRWHMTLSRFLRDYLYIALGGNRKGVLRRYLHLFVTMLLGGLWHGAGWNFVFWGGLHGLYLCLNHGWRALRPSLPIPELPSRFVAPATTALTFVAVAFGWVFFRAESFEGATTLVSAMIQLPDAAFASMARRGEAALWILPLLCWVFFLPNSQWILRGTGPPALPDAPAFNEDRLPTVPIRWRASPGWAVALAVVAIAALIAISTGQPSEFIYYQF